MRDLKTLLGIVTRMILLLENLWHYLVIGMWAIAIIMMVQVN
jgi:hypothetical protein